MVAPQDLERLACIQNIVAHTIQRWRTLGPQKCNEVMRGAIFGQHLHIKGAQIFVVNLPTIQGLGQFGGFDMWLQDRAGLGEQALMAARNQLLGAAAQDPSLMAVRPPEFGAN